MPDPWLRPARITTSTPSLATVPQSTFSQNEGRFSEHTDQMFRCRLQTVWARCLVPPIPSGEWVIPQAHWQAAQAGDRTVRPIPYNQAQTDNITSTNKLVPGFRSNLRLTLSTINIRCPHPHHSRPAARPLISCHDNPLANSVR